MNARKLIILGLASAIAFLSWLVIKDPDATPTTAPSNPSLTTEHTAPSIANAPSLKDPSASLQSPTPQQSTTTPITTTPPKEPAAPPVWESKIDQVLQSNVEHSTMALTLLREIPSMPPEGQTATAQHIANLIADKDFDKLHPYLQNTRLSQGFLEVLTADSLNRPDKVKLPTLLLAAKTPNHPMAETAKGFLAVLVGEDHGSNWNLWDQSIKKVLAESAAQETATPTPTEPAPTPAPTPTPAPAEPTSNQ